MYFTNIRNIFVAVNLYLLQLGLMLCGVHFFSLDVNAVLLFLVSMAIPLHYLYIVLKYGDDSSDTVGFDAKIIVPKQKYLLWAAVGLVTFLLTGLWFYNMLCARPDIYAGSDVLGQLFIECRRYFAGEFPYTIVDIPEFDRPPFPTHMPLHWLPIQLAVLCKVDIRWSGFMILALVGAIYAGFLARSNHPAWLKTLVACLPVMVILLFLAKFFRFNVIDITCSLETLVAAYYLLLAIGLIYDNIWLIFLGLLGCLMSRYTLVFWLPVFGFLLLKNKSLQQNIIFWLGIVGAIFVLYIYPFLLKDPTIFTKGVVYHNMAAIVAWQNSEEISNGIYFVSIFRKNMHGSTIEHGVKVIRIVQAILMLLSCVLSFFYYYKWKNKISYNTFGLITLLLILHLFYFFSPNTYPYYYIPTFILSGVICGRIILFTPKKSSNLVSITSE